MCGPRRTRPKLSTVIVRVRPPGALLDGKVFTVDVLGCSDFGEQERITVARRSGNNRHFPAIPLNLIGRNTGTSTSLGLLDARGPALARALSTRGLKARMPGTQAA